MQSGRVALHYTTGALAGSRVVLRYTAFLQYIRVIVSIGKRVVLQYITGIVLACSQVALQYTT